MAAAHTRSPFVMRRQRSALQEGFACAVWSFQSGRIPRAFLHFCAPPSPPGCALPPRVGGPVPSGPSPSRRAAVCQFCCLRAAARWPRAHRGPASLDLLLMKKPHGIALPFLPLRCSTHSCVIPLVSDPSSASSYHNQRFDRGPSGLTWTRVLRGIGRALFRGSRSYSRQVSAAQQIDVPSLEEVRTNGRRDKKE